MNRMRIFLVLALALTAGGVLAFGTYSYLQNQPPKVVSMPTKPVVVASADLTVGTELRTDDMRVVQWPAANVPEGAFSNPAELQGRGVVMSIVRNEPVLPAKLASKEAGAGLPTAIPAGMRAVSVRVNEVIGVAGYVLPGTRVDVVATGSPNDQRADTTSKVVLTNVQVLATGTKIEQTGDKGKPIQATVVTLLVTPEEAERLTLASTEGKIQLALRNPLDQSAPPTPGVKPAVLLGTAEPARVARVAAQRSPHVPAPVVEAAPAPTIEMIRGDKRAYEVVK
jgi:pilus assembly protein CpaB